MRENPVMAASLAERNDEAARQPDPAGRSTVRRWIPGFIIVLACVVFALATGAILLLATAPLPSRLRELARAPMLHVEVPPPGRSARVRMNYGLPVSYEDLPPYLVTALIASEDHRFWSHPGVDPLAWIRALRDPAVGWLRGRSPPLQGGSTLTQQLVKMLLLEPRRTLARKALEVPLALYVDTVLSKRRIVEAYLNRAYFGNGCYGIEAAARCYFHRRARDLDPWQAALLVATLPSPTLRNPWRRRPLLERRARQILRAVRQQGLYAPFPLPRRVRNYVWHPWAHFFARDLAREELGRLPPPVREGPRVLFLTIDPELQLYAELAVERAMRERGRFGFDQVALVAMSPDGRIRAMVGGRRYGDAVWNRAVRARRQPGSAFKPLVYLAALEAGLRPGTPLFDLPVEIDGYRPRNIDNRFLGRISLEEALVRSRNVATVRLAERIGRPAIRRLARRLGYEGELPDDPTVALGSGATTLVDLVETYAAFANGGRPVRARVIEAVRRPDGGFLYYHSHTAGPPVVARRHLCELVGMLQRVLGPHGTGRRAAFGHPAAGKTGTSQRNRDAWFIGFTAHLVAGVWVGRDDDRPMRGLTGGDLPARTWRNFMTNAHLGVPKAPLPGC